MAEFIKRTLKNDATLDGNTYVDCAFVDVTMSYSGGVPPIFTNCSFENARFNLTGPANNTILLLRGLASSTGLRDVVTGLIPEMKV